MRVTAIRDALRRIPAPVRDALLALVVALIVAFYVRVGSEAGARAPDALGYGLALFTAGVLAWRRRWPQGVLVAAALSSTVYHVLNYSGGPPTLALYVALYTAAAMGRRRIALLIGVSVAVGGLAFRVFVEHEGLLPVTIETALVAAVLTAGEAVYSRRAWAAEVRERQGRAEADRELDAQRRVAEERLRIARELHDVMAHTIASITVQAGVAADVLRDSPDQAIDALRTIRSASREALTELKATVGLLRQSGPADGLRAPAPGLDQLDGLLDMVTGAGMGTEVAVTGRPRPLPAAVDLTAYRIVQESLTNVLRHARATRTRVLIAYQADSVTVTVDDDGRGSDGVPADGYGLAGMRERAAALGGRLEAGVAAEGGFRVQAWLPAGRPLPPAG